MWCSAELYDLSGRVMTASRPIAKGSKNRPGVGRSEGQSARAKTQPEPRPRLPRQAAGGKAPARTSALAPGKRRKIFVFAGLVSAMTLTSVLLLVLQQAPLTPDAARTLMAIDTPAQIDAVFETQIPLQTARWKYIYVHHGGQPSGPGNSKSDTDASPDHFIIGNGEGSAGDGQVQVGQRWTAQQPAGKTSGLDRVDPDCVSVRLAGDLDRGTPTPRQMEQLNRLVTALQDRLQITRDRVWVVDAAGLPAGCGKYFPRDAFVSALLP